MINTSSELSTVRLELLDKKYRECLLPFLDEVGISPDIFQDPNYECSLPKHVALLEVAAKKLKRNNLGLQFGRQVLSTDFGVLGQVIRSHKTVRDIFIWLDKYFVIHQQSSSISFNISNERCSISYQIDDPSIIEKRQDTEFSIAAIHALILELAQEKPQLIRVDFTHDRPESIIEHQDFFERPVYFKQPKNCLIYKNNMLDFQLKTSNYVILDALKSYIEELHKQRSTTSDFITQLNIVISRQLGNGGTNLPRVAEEMAMSTRTLQRRLALLGIQFGEHIEELRKSMALHYITKKQCCLTDIALLLGYSEASSFSRAFKRWTGSTPGQYRKKLHY